MKTPISAIATSVALAALAGCAPNIQKVAVSGVDTEKPTHGQEVHVDAYIVPQLGGAGTPELKVKAYAPEGASWSDAGELGAREEIGPVPLPIDGHTIEFTGYRYYGELSHPLDYGGYTLRTAVPYSSWGHRYQEAKDKDFLVEAPPWCFSFDHGTDDFAVEVCDSHREHCRDIAARLLSQNWPFGDVTPSIEHHSLSFQILANSFPQPPDNNPDTPEENYYWIADFVSPVLNQREHWQSAQGVTFRAATRALKTYAQPVLEVRDPDGHTKWYAPTDPETHKFLAYPITDTGGDPGWKVIEWRSNPPFEGSLTSVRLRIYGDAKLVPLNNETTVYLDGVCPIPPGIDPAGAEIAEPIPNPWQ